MELRELTKKLHREMSGYTFTIGEMIERVRAFDKDCGIVFGLGEVYSEDIGDGYMRGIQFFFEPFDINDKNNYFAEAEAFNRLDEVYALYAVNTYEEDGRVITFEIVKPNEEEPWGEDIDEE